jgi:hypothetical protein
LCSGKQIEEMKNEKIYELETGRTAKVITRGILASDLSKVIIETEVLVKDQREEEFHPPIGLSHPKYWKLKRLTAEQSRKLQIQYSGVSDKQIRKAVREFEKMLNQEVLH